MFKKASLIVVLALFSVVKPRNNPSYRQSDLPYVASGSFAPSAPPYEDLYPSHDSGAPYISSSSSYAPSAPVYTANTLTLLIDGASYTFKQGRDNDLAALQLESIIDMFKESSDKEMLYTAFQDALNRWNVPGHEVIIKVQKSSYSTHTISIRVKKDGSTLYNKEIELNNRLDSTYTAPTNQGPTLIQVATISAGIGIGGWFLHNLLSK